MAPHSEINGGIFERNENFLTIEQTLEQMERAHEIIRSSASQQIE
jgi:hypothetical protein